MKPIGWRLLGACILLTLVACDVGDILSPHANSNSNGGGSGSSGGGTGSTGGALEFECQRSACTGSATYPRGGVPPGA